MQQITIALAKGRLADMSIELLEKCGVDCTEIKKPGRKLVFDAGDFKFILVKPSDVPTYVYYGVADLGIAGKDVLMESELPLYEMLDLGFGRCRLCICGYPGGEKKKVTVGNLRVATKFTQITRKYYMSRDMSVELIKLNGSVEIAPVLGLADVIVDLVESGATLKENGLEILEDIVEDITARVVVNRVSLKTKGRELKSVIAKMKEQIG